MQKSLVALAALFGTLKSVLNLNFLAVNLFSLHSESLLFCVRKQK